MGVNYRLKFTKLGDMRFIGHLDMMRIFRLAINRSGIPVSYSQGFNPHHKLSFALPLPLGMSSIGEFADIELEAELPAEAIINALNKCMPNGTAVTGAKMLVPGGKNAASLVRYAEYEADISMCALSPYENYSIGENIAALMDSGEILTEVKTKSGAKQANIRPDIIAMRESEPYSVTIITAAGSSHNLKPEFPIRLLCEKAGIEYDSGKILYMRKSLLGEDLVEL